MSILKSPSLICVKPYFQLQSLRIEMSKELESQVVNLLEEIIEDILRKKTSVEELSRKHYAGIVKESLPNWLLTYLTYKTNVKAAQKTEELILTNQKSSEMLTNLAGLFHKYIMEVREQSKKMTLMTIANFCLVAATTASIILQFFHLIHLI